MFQFSGRPDCWVERAISPHYHLMEAFTVANPICLTQRRKDAKGIRNQVLASRRENGEMNVRYAGKFGLTNRSGLHIHRIVSGRLLSGIREGICRFDFSHG